MASAIALCSKYCTSTLVMSASFDTNMRAFCQNAFFAIMVFHTLLEILRLTYIRPVVWSIRLHPTICKTQVLQLLLCVLRYEIRTWNYEHLANLIADECILSSFSDHRQSNMLLLSCPLLFSFNAFKDS